MDVKPEPQKFAKRESATGGAPLDRRAASMIASGRIEPEPLVVFQVKLREAWDSFRTCRLADAQTTARTLIADLEPLPEPGRHPGAGDH